MEERRGEAFFARNICYPAAANKNASLLVEHWSNG